MCKRFVLIFTSAHTKSAYEITLEIGTLNILIDDTFVRKPQLQITVWLVL